MIREGLFMSRLFGRGLLRRPLTRGNGFGGEGARFLSPAPFPPPQRFHRVPICRWADSEPAPNHWLHMAPNHGLRHSRQAP